MITNCWALIHSKVPLVQENENCNEDEAVPLLSLESDLNAVPREESSALTPDSDFNFDGSRSSRKTRARPRRSLSRVAEESRGAHEEDQDAVALREELEPQNVSATSRGVLGSARGSVATVSTRGSRSGSVATATGSASGGSGTRTGSLTVTVTPTPSPTGTATQSECEIDGAEYERRSNAAELMQKEDHWVQWR